MNNRHLIKNNVNTESVVNIYYTFGISKPEEENKINEEDWIKHIALI